MKSRLENPLILFTKPWPGLSLPELGRLVKRLGCDGVELPVRPGYQVTPDRVAKGLPEAARLLSKEGVKIGSVAGSTDEATIAACGEAGVPILRVCLAVDLKMGYKASEEKLRREYDALVPLLRKHNVSIGVQNHCGNMIGSAIGVMHLIEGYEPAAVSAVLDPAHCAVAGEPPEMAIDIVWSHLSLMNFKAASHWRTNGLNAPEAAWEVYWTTAQHSGYSWKAAVAELKKRDYSKDICLPAEYSDWRKGGQLMGDDVIPFLSHDVAYLKHLMGEGGTEAAAAPR